MKLKINKYLLIQCFLFATCFSFSQKQVKVDRLVIQKSGNDTIKLQHYNELPRFGVLEKMETDGIETNESYKAFKKLISSKKDL